jgi:glycine betaine/proline transport system substrate-binding protein
MIRSSIDGLRDSFRRAGTGTGIAVLALLMAAALVSCGGTAGTGVGDGAGRGGAGSETAGEPGTPRPSITLASPAWSSAVAGSNLVKALLEERLGYRVSIRLMDADEMWASVASGEADAAVSAWLPRTHEVYAEEFGDQVVDLGANLEGVRTGFVVPRVSVGRQTDASGTQVQRYIPVTSIAELAEYADGFDGRIVGIEPTAGIMQRAREALQVYDLQDEFRLVEGTEADMIAELERAIRTQSWIMVTGWAPHWAFGQWELEFLDDPRNAFGTGEEIHTIVTPELGAEHPEVYAVLDRFNWSLDDIGQVMLWIRRDDGIDPYAKAQRWVRTHPEQVERWLSGTEVEEGGQ